jgi:outer membrane protein
MALASTLALIAWGLGASAAAAQQPLPELLRAAAERSFAARLARAALDEAGGRADQARGRLLPSLSARASYTRNQEEVVAEFPGGPGGEIQRATIVAEDQLEATIRLDVPLLDVAAWSRFLGAEQRTEAARARLARAAQSVSSQVVSAYYQLVAARALVEATERSIATAEDNLRAVEARFAAGIASEVDRQRARADVARAQQTRAEAELDVALSTRRLERLTGMRPSEARVTLEDALQAEAPLERWLGAAEETPAVQAADREVRAAELERDAAWQTLLPVVSAFASERFTNAAGFGPNALWALGVELRWQLDFALPASFVSSERTLARARVEAEQARDEAQTGIYEEWHRVRTLLERARAARAAEEASIAAARAARARYDAGTGTQLEVSQTERDRLSAEVSRVQADADLRVARLTLRLESGLPPQEGAAP